MMRLRKREDSLQLRWWDRLEITAVYRLGVVPAEILYQW